MQTQSFPAQGFDIRVSNSLDMIGIIFTYRTPDMEADEENLSTPRIILGIDEARTLIDALQRTVEASETGVMPDSPQQTT